MKIKANICQVCGGTLKDKGTYFKCESCDAEYRIDDTMSQEEMDAYFRRLNDFEDAERNLDIKPPRFEDAESEFERIVRKYPDWSAGYWGLVRAKFGIVFEPDSDGKAVPSCYKSTYNDFRNTDEYNEAIELAETEELRQNYKKWAEYISRVAKEWREEAQKYDYDVFISFKASDDTDGGETHDSREMHKLYQLLREKGYRVFFSPVTLVAEGVAGKGSEPYIFNALDKAKALIVYGSRKEYFASTWVQNEWQRYLRAVKTGKKAKDSLLVLYEGFNPKELPQGLRRIQGIEYGISAWPAISAALERILGSDKKKKLVEEEAARKAEENLRIEQEKRKAEEENTKRLQNMMAQFEQMQAELSRLKSASSLPMPPQPAPVEKNKDKSNLNETVVPKPAIKTVPQPSVVKGDDPYHGQNKDDFQIENGILKKYKGNQSEVIIPDNVTSIGLRAFADCRSLSSITIPISVTSIGSHAFSGCSSLTSITIPNSVTSIGAGVFASCSSLTSITIPDRVTSIGEDAFWYCSSLTSITIPNSVTSIGKDAFSGCAGIIETENGVSYVDKWVISCAKSATTVSLRSDTVGIGDHAFWDCGSLTSVTIPKSVTSIGRGVFIKCSSLKSIAIPNSVTSIGGDAFRISKDVWDWSHGTLTSVYITDLAAWCNIRFGNYNANPLYYLGNLYLNNKLVTELVIPDGVTSIGACAFAGCNWLESITIPDSVTSIGYGAFRGCSSLTSITIPNSVTSIGKDAFSDCAGIIETENGVSYVDKWIIGCAKSARTVSLRLDTVGIGDHAFDGCTSLKSITIPSGITSIGKGAFYECSLLTSITIPDSVTSIGEDAFRGCSSLTSITIPNSVKSIGEDAFSYCSGLRKVTVSRNTKGIYSAFDYRVKIILQ